MLNHFPELEKSLRPGFANQPADLLAHDLVDCLEKLNSIDTKKIAEEYLAKKQDEFRGLFLGALEQRLSMDPLDLDSSFVRNSLLRMSWKNVGEEIHILTPQKPVELPAIFSEQIDFCLSGETFRGRDIPGMSEEEQKVLVKRLAAEGLVIPSPG
jgi:hypothetical protein